MCSSSVQAAQRARPCEALPLRGVGEAELEVAAAEGVAPVADPVGPRHQQLAAAAARHLGLAEAVHQVAPVVPQHPQRGAALGDHGDVARRRDLELVAARKHHVGHPRQHYRSAMGITTRDLAPEDAAAPRRADAADRGRPPDRLLPGGRRGRRDHARQARRRLRGRLRRRRPGGLHGGDARRCRSDEGPEASRCSATSTRGGWARGSAPSCSGGRSTGRGPSTPRSPRRAGRATPAPRSPTGTTRRS